MKNKKIKRIYPALTAELKLNNCCEYDLGVIISTYKEMKKGLKVLSKSNPSEEGVTIEYIPFENKDDELAYKELINLEIKNFEAKYEGWDLLPLLEK